MTPEDLVRGLLEYMGEDPTREGLVRTPARVLAAWRELTVGYQQDPAVVLARDFAADGYDEMIVCRNVEFYSTCEHHLLPFHGVAHLGYLPAGRVVGISKLARLVDVFARRLQLQERMTAQLAQAVQTHLEPQGVGVVVRARHLCMACRGVQKEEADLVTCALLGSFRDPAVRAEFMGHVRGA